jgi:hypothetical protein
MTGADREIVGFEDGQKAETEAILVGLARLASNVFQFTIVVMEK